MCLTSALNHVGLRRRSWFPLENRERHTLLTEDDKLAGEHRRQSQESDEQKLIRSPGAGMAASAVKSSPRPKNPNQKVAVVC